MKDKLWWVMLGLAAILMLSNAKAGEWNDAKKIWSDGSIFAEVEKRLQDYRESPRLELEAWNEKVEKKKKKKSPKKSKAKKPSAKKK